MLARSHIEPTNRDPIARIEPSGDSKVAETPRLGRSKQLSASTRSTRNAWFVVRAVAAFDDAFRFASTAPFHFEIPAGTRRVRRDSAQFLVDWIEERMGRIRRNLTDPHLLRAVLAPQEHPLAFWHAKLAGSATD